MGLIESVLSALLAKLLADESHAWMPRIVERLIYRAISKLPDDQRERFDEEWRSDIDETPGLISKLTKAIGFGFAARRITHIIERDREVQRIEAFWNWFDREFYNCFREALDQEFSIEEANASGADGPSFRAKIMKLFGPGDILDVMWNISAHSRPNKEELIKVTRSVIRQVILRGRPQKGILVTGKFPRREVRRFG